MNKGVRVLMCGHYGESGGGVNGQSIKTQLLHTAIERRFGGGAVTALDTSQVFTSPVRFYVAARRASSLATDVILMPGPRGVRALVPLFTRWRRTLGLRVHHVVVGGWLPDMLAKSPWLRSRCKELDGVYVEATAMAGRLQDLGLTNVRILRNFRVFDTNVTSRNLRMTGPLRLVSCGRIESKKGVEDAVVAVDELNAGASAPLVTLDVYGPILTGYESRILPLIERARGVCYRGVLRGPEDVYSTLKQYELMVFPTHYVDEGVPGIIVESFIAGVPVISYDWYYSSELIQPGSTGVICAERSPQALAAAIRQFIEHRASIDKMRGACLAAAREYHVDTAVAGLLLDIERAAIPNVQTA